MIVSVPSAANADAIRALNVTSTTTSSNVRVYNNTIYLNASGLTTFGTTGIFHAASGTATTAALDMRNNIVVNMSTPGSTAGVTSALRRSVAATYGNWATTSNNNMLVAGTLGAANAILNDAGTVYPTSGSGFAFNNYKSTVSTRDVTSFTTEAGFTYPTPGSFFQSVTCTDPTYLHLVNGITTQAEGGASAIAGITTDYDGDTRNATKPDVGADEFSGTSPAPSVTQNGAAPTGGCTATGHLISVNATTPAGTISGVTITYNNGALSSNIAMTNTSGDIWEILFQLLHQRIQQLPGL